MPQRSMGKHIQWPWPVAFHSLPYIKIRFPPQGMRPQGTVTATTAITPPIIGKHPRISLSLRASGAEGEVQRALCLSCMYCWLQGWRSQLHIIAPASQNGRAAQRRLGHWALHLAFYESHLQSQHTPSSRLLYLCATVPLGMLNVAAQCQTSTPLHN
jgi:hypothetical protein